MGYACSWALAREIWAVDCQTSAEDTFWVVHFGLVVFGGVCVRRCFSNFTTAVKLVGTTGISGRGGLGSAVNMFYPPLNHLTTLIANSANSEPNKEKHKR